MLAKSWNGVSTRLSLLLVCYRFQLSVRTDQGIQDQVFPSARIKNHFAGCKRFSREIRSFKRHYDVSLPRGLTLITPIEATKK